MRIVKIDAIPLGCIVFLPYSRITCELPCVKGVRGQCGPAVMADFNLACGLGLIYGAGRKIMVVGPHHQDRHSNESINRSSLYLCTQQACKKDSLRSANV